jgi:predicted RNase H-like HicB family nuclease
MVYKVTVIVQKDDDWYVAKCLENSVASQGKTVEEAIENLKEALELYYEDMQSDIVEPRQTFVTTLEVSV